MGCDIHPAFQKKVVDAEGKESWEYIPHNYEANRHYRLFGWLADVRNGYGFAGSDTGDAIKPLSEPRGLPEGVVEKDYPDESDEPGWWDSEAYHLHHQNGGDFGDHSQSWLLGSEILAGREELAPQKYRGVLSLREFKQWDRVSEPDGYSGHTMGPGYITVPQHIAEQFPKRYEDYMESIDKELRNVTKRMNRKVRTEKKVVSSTGMYSSWSIRPLFGYSGPIKFGHEIHDPVTKWVPKRKVNARKSVLKHQRKLEKYARRLGRVNVHAEWTLPSSAVQQQFAYFTDEVQRLVDEHGEIRMVFGFDS